MSNYPTVVDDASSLYAPIDVYSTKPGRTTTTASCLSSDASIQVADTTTGFPAAYGIITIGDEKILYASKDSTHFLGCTRGFGSSTPAGHASGVAVKALFVTDYITALQSALEAVQTQVGITGAFNFLLSALPIILTKAGGDALFAEYNTGLPRLGFSVAANSGNAVLTYNLVFSSANTWTHQTTGQAWIFGDPFGAGVLGLYMHTGSAGSTFDIATSAQCLAVSSSGNLGVGVSAALNKLHVNVGANENLHLRGPVDVSGSVVLQTVNDANNANTPLEFRASSYDFRVGSVKLNSGASVNDIVTSIGTPGVDTKLATEKSIRTAIEASNLPTGGSTGYVLTKDSGTDFDATWHAPSVGGFVGAGAWLGYNPTTYGTGNANLLFDQVDYNIGSMYNPATGLFTVPSTGYYLITGQVHASGTGTPVLSILINGIPETFVYVDATINDNILTLTKVMLLTAGDTVQFQVALVNPGGIYGASIGNVKPSPTHGAVVKLG